MYNLVEVNIKTMKTLAICEMFGLVIAQRV